MYFSSYHFIVGRVNSQIVVFDLIVKSGQNKSSKHENVMVLYYLLK